MNRNEIKNRFYTILKHQLYLDNNYFSRFSEDGENQLLIEELHADALDWYEILAAIELEFNIIIRDKEVEKCKTLHDFINLIDNIVNKNKYE